MEKTERHLLATPEQMLEPLLNGNDIMRETHLKPGPLVGLIREALLQAQIAAGLRPDAPCGGKGTCGSRCLFYGNGFCFSTVYFLDKVFSTCYTRIE